MKHNQFLVFDNFHLFCIIFDAYSFYIINLTDCPNYEKLRESTPKSIQDTEHIDLIRGNIKRKLRELFSNGSPQSLYTEGPCK